MAYKYIVRDLEVVKIDFLKDTMKSHKVVLPDGRTVYIKKENTLCDTESEATVVLRDMMYQRIQKTLCTYDNARQVYIILVDKLATENDYII